MRQIAIGVLLAVVASGCGKGAETAQRASAQSAINAAVRSVADKDFAAAEKSWSEAIAIGGLNGDQYVQAFLERAICRARLSRYDAALADLKQIEPLAPNLDEVYLVRAFVLDRQGRTALGKAELAKARKLNARAEPIHD